MDLLLLVALCTISCIFDPFLFHKSSNTVNNMMDFRFVYKKHGGMQLKKIISSVKNVSETGSGAREKKMERRIRRYDDQLAKV